MKAYTAKELDAFLTSLISEYDVRVPVEASDGTRVLGRPGDGQLALAGGAVSTKPTAVFFPHFEKVFTQHDDQLDIQKPVEKPILVVGYTAEDAESLEFIDRFYSENFRDDIYFNKRDRSVVVVVSGRCGKDGEFLKIAGGKCDLELVYDGERFVAVPYSKTGKALAAKIEGGEAVDDDVLEGLRRESDALPTDDEELLRRASKLLQKDKVPDEFWEAISDRCIACTSCNLVCPTCTCFEVFDRVKVSEVERNRMWDSCQLGGFMREASGHNPMGKEFQRTRRRIHHKLAADVTRWETISCFLCGRCDEACPTGIGIKAVCREMVEKYG